MANKEIREFSTLTAATGDELLLFMLSGVTKNMSLDVAKEYIFGSAGGNLSYLGFNIVPNEISQDITLPENSTVYFNGDLNIASGYTLTIPSGTTLNIVDPTLDITVTGGTFLNGTATFTDNIGDKFEVTGFTSLADVWFNAIPNEISQDITLPENSTVYYYGDLNMASGYTLTIPSGTTLTFIDPTLDITVTGGTFSNGVATFTDNIGDSFEVTGFTSLADVGFNVIPNEINQDVVLPDNSTVYFNGNVNMGSGYTLTIPSGTTLEFIGENDIFITGDTSNNSVLLGGIGNEINTSSNNNVIVGGSNNVINSLSDNSVVIGGVGITGTTANTVYVPKLNINDLPIGDALNNLAIDSNGNIVVSDLYSLSDLGFNITSRPSTVIYQNIILPENTDVTYTSPLTMDINNIIIVPINTILTII